MNTSLGEIDDIEDELAHGQSISVEGPRESFINDEFRYLDQFVRGTRMSRRELDEGRVDLQELDMYRSLFVEN